MIFLILVLLSGCVSMQTTNPQNLQRVYSHNFETTWKVIIDILAKEGSPLQSTDKESGLIHTGNIQDTWAIYNSRYSLTFFVSSADIDKTRVIINPLYEAYFPGQIGTLQNGEWKQIHNKDKLVVDEYFKKLDSILISSPAS